MRNKIISVVFFVVGAISGLFALFSFFTPKKPGPQSFAYNLGYYSFPFILLIIALIFIYIGGEMNKKFRKEKLKKDLIDSLPK